MHLHQERGRSLLCFCPSCPNCPTRHSLGCSKMTVPLVCGIGAPDHPLPALGSLTLHMVGLSDPTSLVVDPARQGLHLT